MPARWWWLVAVLVAVSCNSEFEDYQRRGKAIEARVMLARLERNIKVYAVEHSQIPPGKALLTPETSCCKLPDGKCPPDDATWKVEPWISLDFAILDWHRFQSRYQSNGSTFTAHAVADLSCKGDKITFTLRGTYDPATDQVTTQLEDPLPSKRR